MYVDETLHKFLVGDSKARTVESISAVIKSKYPDVGVMFLNDAAHGVVAYRERRKAERSAKKLDPHCYWRRIMVWSDTDPMSGGRLVAYIRTTSADIVTDEWLDEVAGTMRVGSDGPGKFFAHVPHHYSLDNGVYKVVQHFGYDV